ncbi:hypothetical protein [Streptococcus ovis]|uniref:hypothetical protein n=1 Tax=Streptococcus ovis TaxID=82806 RepID=UPI0003640459|nr:hypothetical protein [Streptococcus ovis]
MAMLHVECNSCGAFSALRGWIEPEDLVGTIWEGFTEDQIKKAEKEDPLIFEGLDPWDKFIENPVCNECGSDKVISY